VEVAEERLLAGLRNEPGVSFEEVRALGLSPVHKEVRDLIAAGLLAPDPDRLRATTTGRLILDHVTSRLAT
jgi:oxygen-independent coproporphyrinogen-3 oxidase